MRTSLFYYIPICTLLSLYCIACNKPNNINNNINLLQKAQKLANENPALALSVLDSIEAPEQSLDDKHYMQYIVAKTQIRFSNKLDMNDDSTKLNIEKAINYFETKEKNNQQLALAYFYAGNTHTSQHESGYAFRYYRKTIETLKKNNVMLNGSELFLLGKALFNSGLYLFFNNLPDSANLKWEQSLKIFRKLDKRPNIATNLYYLALAKLDLSKIEESKQYATQSLDLASEINDTYNIFCNTLHMGIVYREEGNYKQALFFFNQAMQSATCYIDSTKIYMGFADTYTRMKDAKRAKKHVAMLEQRISKTPDILTLYSLLTDITNYYKLVSNRKLANQYEQFTEAIYAQIDNQKITTDLYGADKTNILDQYKEKNTQKKHNYLITSTLLILSFILFLLYFKKRIIKKVSLINFNIKQLRYFKKYRIP